MGVVSKNYPEPVASDYPELLNILIDRVKPQRDEIVARGKQIHEYCFWKFWDRRDKLYSSIKSTKNVLAKGQVSSSWAFEYVDGTHIYDQKLVLFVDVPFCVLQSNVHYSWVLKYASTMGKSGINYTPTDCCETFPFPDHSQKLSIESGDEFRSIRNSIQRDRQIGMTGVWGLLNNPSESSSDILRLRAAYRAMDNLVLQDYGWSDIDPDHGFHETKQGIRFTFSEAARHEILDRLLVLNRQRYAAEVDTSLHEKKLARPAKYRKVTAAVDTVLQDDLFGQMPITSTPIHDSVSGTKPIVEYLKINPGWQSKDDIITATGFPVNRWNAAIRDLLDSGKVDRQGEKRGTKYRIAETQK